MFLGCPSGLIFNSVWDQSLEGGGFRFHAAGAPRNEIGEQLCKVVGQESSGKNYLLPAILQVVPKQTDFGGTAAERGLFGSSTT